MTRMLRNVAVLALALTACTDLTKYTTQAEALVKQFGPKVLDLMKSNDGLLERMKGLPQGFAGVSDIITKLGANRDKLMGLKGLVDMLPGQLATAVKGGQEDAVKKLLETFTKDIGSGMTSAGDAVKSLTAEVATVEEAVKAASAAPAAGGGMVGEFMKTLSSGFSIKGQVTGIEAQLVGFIEDGGKAVDKTTWFDFDRLLFKTGSADLDMEKSKDQLTNVAEILKAYPKVELKVGGYTDNQGKPAANLKLSEARAKAVAAQLKAMGIDAKRLDPEGYGQQHPVCEANDTDECRAKNRRISVRVKAK